MILNNKTIVNYKNKCSICSKKLYENDIIIKENLFCHECYTIISKIEINDIKYDFYKEKIKSWLLRKYNNII